MPTSIIKENGKIRRKFKFIQVNITRSSTITNIALSSAANPQLEFQVSISAGAFPNLLCIPIRFFVEEKIYQGNGKVNFIYSLNFKICSSGVHYLFPIQKTLIRFVPLAFEILTFCFTVKSFQAISHD